MFYGELRLNGGDARQGARGLSFLRFVPFSHRCGPIGETSGIGVHLTFSYYVACVARDDVIFVLVFSGISQLWEDWLVHLYQCGLM